MCLSTAFQSNPSSCASCSLSLGLERASRSLILVFAPFILTNSPKTSESNPRSVHLDFILPLHIHIPPTRNQLVGASVSEWTSKNCAKTPNVNEDRGVTDPAEEPKLLASPVWRLEIPAV